MLLVIGKPAVSPRLCVPDVKRDVQIPELCKPGAPGNKIGKQRPADPCGTHADGAEPELRVDCAPENKTVIALVGFAECCKT